MKCNPSRSKFSADVVRTWGDTRGRWHLVESPGLQTFPQMVHSKANPQLVPASVMSFLGARPDVELTL